jgi:LPS-assembly protein
MTLGPGAQFADTVPRPPCPLLLPAVPATIGAVALALAALCAPRLAWAQCQAQVPAANPWAQRGLRLVHSEQLSEEVGDSQRRQAQRHLEAQTLRGEIDGQTQLQGQASLRMPGLVVRAQEIIHDAQTNSIQARGEVLINHEGNRFTGQGLVLQLDAFRGRFEIQEYSFGSVGAHGQASEIVFLGDKRSRISDATYTTCPRVPGSQWLPDWLIKAKTLDVDEEESVVNAQGTQLRFKDVPILALPSMDFPLTSGRKSGWLPPTIGLDSKSGLVLTAPYYWDIAPHRDATFSATTMVKRGVSLGAEMRYLERDHRGEIQLNVMPDDRLRERDRFGLLLQHHGRIETGAWAPGHINMDLQIARVSDDDYWQDFPQSGQQLVQRLLSSSAQLQWADGPWSMRLQSQQWQTLQNASSPITPPYDKKPQWVAQYQQALDSGWDVQVQLDTTRFEADYSRLTNSTATASNGQRSYALGHISYPVVRPWGHITPKLQAHLTRYELDAPLSNGQRVLDRQVPAFSLDSGLVFERTIAMGARGMVQTLEPRAFYVYAPYRDQSVLPVYDSGATDFNFASIFSESPYVGQDRIADSHVLTIGMSSRFFDSGDGTQVLQTGIAQRYRFDEQRVTLPGQPSVNEQSSDILMGGSVNWNSRWSADGLVQYDQNIGRAQRATWSTRYSPGPYRVLNLAYRSKHAQSELLELAWQWPILSAGPADQAGSDSAGHWYSVARFNYSLKDSRLVDTLIGFEYDAGCWLARAVFERQQSSLVNASTRMMFQLEFVGFSRIGTNPIKTLQNNISRYQQLGQDRPSFSRFGTYDE